MAIIKRKIVKGEEGCKCRKCQKEVTYMLDVTDNIGKLLSIPYCDDCIIIVMNIV